jgi:hypothetical protein
MDDTFDLDAIVIPGHTDVVVKLVPKAGANGKGDENPEPARRQRKTRVVEVTEGDAPKAAQGEDWEKRLAEAIDELNRLHFVADMGAQTVILSPTFDETLRRERLLVRAPSGRPPQGGPG